jgi:hypothetical protein
MALKTMVEGYDLESPLYRSRKVCLLTIGKIGCMFMKYLGMRIAIKNTFITGILGYLRHLQ